MTRATDTLPPETIPETESALAGKVQTVLGLIDPDALGITLPHEHLLIDLSIWFVEPKDRAGKHRASEAISLENLGWILFNQYGNFDNMQLLDESLSIQEAQRFKAKGGSSIVDVTSIGLGRNPEALRRISLATNLNVIAGSGYYVLRGKEAEEFDRKTEEEIADEITSDLVEGIDGTNIRAGIIGEIGCSWPLLDREKTCLRAAAKAQQRTGAAITIHPGRGEDSPMEILHLLESAGADLSRVIMGHLDRTGFLPETLRKMARTGCGLEYDLFGGNPFYPLHLGVFRRPCDRERIEQIKELIDEGFLDQIFISQDICLKTKLVRYGSTGYAHILENILPQMRARGITEEHIDTMMVKNPRRLLTFLPTSISASRTR